MSSQAQIVPLMPFNSFFFSDIEDLTRKTGNFKQFPIFCSMLESAVRKVCLKVHAYNAKKTKIEEAQVHTKSIERCEQTQIRSRLCELRQKLIHSSSMFPLE